MERIQSTLSLDHVIAFAAERHRQQVDQSGKPYILHLKAVMDQLVGEESKMTGVLHDIVEDTDTTPEELLEMGVPQKVVDAVVLLTHPVRKKMTEAHYYQDIRNIAFSGNQLAIDTKWADLTHNSDLTRKKEITNRDIKRWQKYQQAKLILKPLVSEYLVNGSAEAA